MPAKTLERVDVGALAGSIVLDARFRLAGAIATSVQTLADLDEALSDRQAKYLLADLLAAFDGFERGVATLVVNDLEMSGVPIWGLPDELADLPANETADDA